MNRSITISLAVVLIACAIGAYLYPSLPDRMASHWNFQGNADGYSEKSFGVFFLPMLALAMLGLFALIPKIDPLKANIESFRGYFDGLVLVFTFFLVYVYILTLGWNYGYEFNMSQALSPAFAVLFYYMGVLVGKAKRNWFVGIRTPWTLSSDAVWDSTHKLGGKIYKACGVIALLGIMLPAYALVFVLVPVIAASIYLVAYSFIEYQKQGKQKQAKA